MSVVPAVSPHTTPDKEPTVATAGLLLLHVPPVIALVNVLHEPSHTCGVPVIGYGARMMVTTFVAIHPVDKVYTIVTVSTELPVITPVTGSMDATNGLVLLHVPPGGVLAIVVDVRLQKPLLPVIGVGSGFTVTTAVRTQPVLMV
jgi:hypothetical protein